MDQTPQEEPRAGEITIRLRRTQLWGLVGVLLGVGIGFAIGRGTAEDPRPILYGAPGQSAAPGAAATQPSNARVRVATAGRPARGPDDAKVTIVEFVDFQCPFCGRFARDTLPRFHRAYGERVRYVSRHFPLASHENAQIAAQAAECAHRMGRYWEYHEALFANQDALDRAGLLRHARHAGLARGRLAACIDSGDTRAQVEKDRTDGRRYGVTGTPTFFVNGMPLRGAQSYDSFKQAVDEELRKKQPG